MGGGVAPSVSGNPLGEAVTPRNERAFAAKVYTIAGCSVAK